MKRTTLSALAALVLAFGVADARTTLPPPTPVVTGGGLTKVGPVLNVLPPVTQRPPLTSDATGYVAGHSQWIDQDGRLFGLDSVTPGGLAMWLRSATPGPMLASLTATAPVVQLSTHRINPAYSGNAFTVLRMSDQTSVDIAYLPNTCPDIAKLAAFLAPTAGRGYVSTWYNQDGSGNHATQTSPVAMPAIDVSDVRNGCDIPLRFNYLERQYWSGVLGATVSWTSGTSMTITNLSGINGQNESYPLLPGMSVTGTNIPANGHLVTINNTTGVITLDVTPTGTPGALTFGGNNTATPGVFLDLSTLTVPWQNSSIIASMQGPSGGGGAKVMMYGVHGADAAAAAGSWWGIQTRGSGTGTGMRFLDGNSVGGGNGNGPMMSNSPQVVFASRNVRIEQWQVNGQFGNLTLGPVIPATTLTGAVVGDNPQFVGYQRQDWYAWDVMGYGVTIVQADVERINAAVFQMHGWAPQLLAGVLFDGSSTTVGNGAGNAGGSWPHKLADRASATNPFIVYNAAGGGPIENENYLWPQVGGTYTTIPNRDLLLFHPGMGNSLQSSSGALTVSSTNTGTCTLTMAVNPQNVANPGQLVSGNVNLPAGARITANTSTTLTIDAPHCPTGNVGTVTVLNDTAANAFQAIKDYVATVIGSNGAKRIVLIGSATRGVFTTPQIAEFATLKTMCRELWQTIPGVSLWVDWEDLPDFGYDGGMTVTAISGQNVTVNSLSAYAANTNRIRWAGMPVDLIANTGGQTITNVAGNVITVSGQTTGLKVGDTISAVNPTPWTQAVTKWTNDHQHFPPAGYDEQSAYLFGQLQAAGLMN